MLRQQHEHGWNLEKTAKSGLQVERSHVVLFTGDGLGLVSANLPLIVVAAEAQLLAEKIYQPRTRCARPPPGFLFLSSASHLQYSIFLSPLFREESRVKGESPLPLEKPNVSTFTGKSTPL